MTVNDVAMELASSLSGIKCVPDVYPLDKTILN